MSKASTTIPSYKVYLRSLIKENGTGVGQIASPQLNAMVVDLINRICTEILLAKASTRNKIKTVQPNDVQTAIRLMYPGELARHAIAYGTKAVSKFQAAESTGNRTTFTEFRFGVGRIERHMRLQLGAGGRISKTAPLYVADAVGYVMSEIIGMASNSARDRKAVRINSRDIFLAIQNDSELQKLFGNSLMAATGVIATEPATKKRERVSSTEGAEKTKSKAKKAKKTEKAEKAKKTEKAEKAKKTEKAEKSKSKSKSKGKQITKMKTPSRDRKYKHPQ